ncbi:MAG: hypothetical protein PHH70_01570 [Candidatus Gracilibacteria bacterium]|nr:hypothetical protein [Candidatus Gracilibacteria bacterium]
MTAQTEENIQVGIQELKEILVGFITEQKGFNEEQKKFNEEQRVFNEEQRSFNVEIDKKVDRVQYFLEEPLAQNTKMFFEEQIEMKATIKELEDEVVHLKNDMLHFTSQLNMLLAR